MRRALLFLIVLALPACSSWYPSEGADTAITLENRSGEPIYYVGMELESSRLIDPIPGFELDEAPFPRLADGASVSVANDAISGYEPGKGVRFFVYVVPSNLDEAAFAGTVTATAAELRRASGRVVVSEL